MVFDHLVEVACFDSHLDLVFKFLWGKDEKILGLADTADYSSDFADSFWNLSGWRSERSEKRQIK
jgi:hypothetical protein